MRYWLNAAHRNPWDSTRSVALVAHWCDQTASKPGNHDDCLLDHSWRAGERKELREEEDSNWVCTFPCSSNYTQRQLKNCQVDFTASIILGILENEGDSNFKRLVHFTCIVKRREPAVCTFQPSQMSFGSKTPCYWMPPSLHPCHSLLTWYSSYITLCKTQYKMQFLLLPTCKVNEFLTHYLFTLGKLLLLHLLRCILMCLFTVCAVVSLPAKGRLCFNHIATQPQAFVKYVLSGQGNELRHE